MNMGVKGLKKLLTSQSGGDGPASSYKEHGLMSILRPVNVNGIEKDIFLVVDASGYIISLIEQMMKDGELRLDLPSEYHKIEEKIVEDINDIVLGQRKPYAFINLEEGVPIMCTENNNELGISNGDIGVLIGKNENRKRKKKK